MQTKTQVLNNVLANLADERTHSASLFLERLISRDFYGSGIERYRVKNLKTGGYVTDVAGLISAMAVDSITVSYPFASAQLLADRVTGYNVKFDNLEVSFTDYSDEDQLFTELFGDTDTTYRLQFHMSYLNDNDPSLQVKLCNVRLVRV